LPWVFLHFATGTKGLLASFQNIAVAIYHGIYSFRLKISIFIEARIRNSRH